MFPILSGFKPFVGLPLNDYNPHRDRFYDQTSKTVVDVWLRGKTLMTSAGTEVTYEIQGSIEKLSACSTSSQELFSAILIRDGTQTSAELWKGSGKLLGVPGAISSCLGLKGSTVVFAYIKDEHLWYRTSEDDFQEETKIAKPPAGAVLVKFGKNEEGFHQFLMFVDEKERYI